MSVNNISFLMPEDEYDSEGKKIYKPLIIVCKEDKRKPGSGGKPKVTYPLIDLDIDKEIKILEAEKRKRLNSAQKSPVPPTFNTNGKRKLILPDNYSSAKNKRRSVRSSSKICSTKRIKRDMAGIGSKVKKNLFSYEEGNPNQKSVSKTKPKNFDQEPKLLPDSDGNSSDHFEEHEIECGVLPKTRAIPASPLSSITSKLENTKISTASPLSSITSKLENTKISSNLTRLEVDKLAREIKQNKKNYEDKYKQDLLKIREIQEKMEKDKNKFIACMDNMLKKLGQTNYEKTNKENKIVSSASPRRKVLTTPKSASQNLRIATLNKNLQRSAKKTTNYFNKMKSDYLLSTPNTKRNELMDGISLKLETQCLMLVDTPVHN